MTAYTAGERPDKPPDGVTISRFRHKRDTAPRQERRPWDDLTRLLSRHAVRREKDGPLWSPVRFCPGTARAAANVEAVTELVYDVDHTPPDWNLLDGVAFVAYTTYSHTAEDPHWRIVIRLARPVPAAEWAQVWQRARARYAPMADPSCKDPCRMYYLPACPPGRPGSARIGAGAPVDAGGLPETPEEVQQRELAAAGSAGPAPRPVGVGAERPGDRFARETNWAEILTLHGWRSGGERRGQEVWRRPGRADDREARSANTTRDGNLWVWTSNAPPFESQRSYTKLHAHVLLEHGGDWSAAVRALAERYAPPPAIGTGPRREGATDGHAPPPGVAPPVAGSGEEPRHEIDAGNRSLPDVAGQAWEALLAYNAPPRLFRYGGALSRLETNDRGGTVTRVLTEDRVRHHLARAASWYRVKREGRDAPARRVPELPPVHVVKDLLATPDPPLPALSRVVSAPVFSPSGEVLTTPGYHQEGRTYYAPLPGATAVPAVPDAPAGEDVARAKALILDELLVDFPFTGESERAHAVALLLLPFLRGMIDGPTPLHLIEKPTVGTGATLLAEALTAPAAGAKPAPMVEGRDDEEWRKRITATLRESPAAVLIDNLRRRLDTAALSAAITAPDTWADRLLGTSETVHLPVRCAWIATGNNPALSDELARRAVRIRLDARVEQPHLREPKEFRHGDLGGWAAAHRHELVWAALVLGRAWVAAGRPPGRRTIGSFESWARVVGGVLETAGIPGFLGNLQELYERSNEERAAWVAFVGAWWDAFADAPTPVKELFPLVAAGDVPLALGDPEKKNSGPVSLGTKIRQAEGRIFAGKRIERAGERKNAILWRLARLDPPGGAPPGPETHRDSPGDSLPQTAGPDLEDAPAGESGESGESFPDLRARAQPQAHLRARPEGPEETPRTHPDRAVPGGNVPVSLGRVSAGAGPETHRGDSPVRGTCDYCGRPMHALREVHGRVHVLCREHDFRPAGGTR
jgi:hypothetical protein